MTPSNGSTCSRTSSGSSTGMCHQTRPRAESAIGTPIRWCGRIRNTNGNCPASWCWKHSTPNGFGRPPGELCAPPLPGLPATRRHHDPTNDQAAPRQSRPRHLPRQRRTAPHHRDSPSPTGRRSNHQEGDSVTDTASLQTRIDCALAHLATAKSAVDELSGIWADTAAHEIQLAIDRLNDQWDTANPVLTNGKGVTA